MAAPLSLITFGGLGILRNGAPAGGTGAQRRRLALLALLAAAGDRGMSREKLLSLLWPESDLERARKNLAQAVYALRRDLGADDLVLGTSELRLNPDLLSSDLTEFRRALAEARPADAVALYHGPFLDGIYLEEAPEFERWAEVERTALAHDYVTALERLAQGTTEQGDARGAVGYWRLLANADPLDARTALGLMGAFAAAGDRRAALQHFRVYEMLLRQELDLAPDAGVQRFADELRRDGASARSATQPPNRPGAPSPAIPIITIPGAPAAKPFFKRTSTRLGILIGLVLGLALMGILWLLLRRPNHAAAGTTPDAAGSYATTTPNPSLPVTQGSLRRDGSLSRFVCCQCQDVQNSDARFRTLRLDVNPRYSRSC
jgi:DNA-binding SARP family transcriptional activator